MVFLFMLLIDKNDTCISSKNCNIIWHEALKNHGDKTNHVCHQALILLPEKYKQNEILEVK